MKKPAFSFKASLSAAARRRGSTADKVLSSFRLAHLFGFGKKKPAAPPPALGRTAAPAQPPAATKATSIHPVSAARRPADEDEEMHGSGTMAAARDRERARCEAIVNCAAGLRNPALAKSIAFTSRMTRKEGIALLESTPAAATVDRRNQARADRNPRIGAHPGEFSAGQTGAARMHGALAAEAARTQTQVQVRASTSTK
ncbi:hypothetical protein [Variovorax atrisoli]|uniref:hypothetical protein n=1 Tax=Variovorax atrisoli TaxID=3394203 RepID=UPI001611C930|nr:hypothetical protein [Variovorax sp. BK613]MBB3637161.1 hypothetical protein [Variovorax sp. BK613]